MKSKTKPDSLEDVLAGNVDIVGLDYITEYQVILFMPPGGDKSNFEYLSKLIFIPPGGDSSNLQHL